MGEPGNETAATHLRGNPLYRWPGYGPESVDGAGSSSVAAGNEKVSTCWHGPEGAAGLPCGRGKQSLPAGCRCGSEQDCEGD